MEFRDHSRESGRSRRNWRGSEAFCGKCMSRFTARLRRPGLAICTVRDAAHRLAALEQGNGDNNADCTNHQAAAIAHAGIRVFVFASIAALVAVQRYEPYNALSTAPSRKPNASNVTAVRRYARYVLSLARCSRPLSYIFVSFRCCNGNGT